MRDRNQIATSAFIRRLAAVTAMLLLDDDEPILVRSAGFSSPRAGAGLA